MKGKVDKDPIRYICHDIIIRYVAERRDSGDNKIDAT